MQVPVKNNLGGNMNQDISKAWLKPDLVYKSENFRVVTTVGASTLSRTNIRGNTYVDAVPSINSTTKITLNTAFTSHLEVGSTYSIDVIVDSTIIPTYTFVFTTTDDMLSGLADLINTTIGSTVATFYFGSPSYILVATSPFTTVSITSFVYVSGGTGQVSYNNYIDDFLVANGNSLNSWVQSDSGGAGILFSMDPGVFNINGLPTYCASTEVANGPTSWHELNQTLPITLPAGNYTAKLRYKANAIQNASVNISTEIGGSAVHSYSVTTGQDYSGVNGAAVRSVTQALTPTTNDLQIRIDVIPTSVTPPPTTSVSVWVVGLELYGPGMYNSILEVTDNFTPGVFAPKIIGWTTLREDIYLFTTECEDADPGNTDPQSLGQIWKFTYDRTADPEVTINPTLTLIYNNFLNFSTQHPIHNPGRVEARYENNDIQKIYWTDNFNPPRYINVADPNVATLSVDQLLLIPSIEFDVPTIKTILKGGNLRSGMYQYVYRLKRNNGAETRFSMPSSLTFLTVMDEGTTVFNKYYAIDSNTTVDKTIEIELTNLDTTFDRVEVAFIYYGVKNAAPECKVFYEAELTNSSMVLKHTGEEDSDYPISLDELTAFSTNIIRAKAIATKNNILFLGNVKVNNFDVDYDSRAYRFPLNSTTTTIYDSANNAYTLDSATWQITHINGTAITAYDVPEKADAIQSYDNQSPFTTSNLLYKPGSASATTLSNLGGQGPNVSYGFETKAIISDERKLAALPAAGSYNSAPYRNVISKTNTILQLGDRDHSNGNFFDCFVSPYYAPLMAGYQRDEMYRFGVVFFDRLGNPSFTKWIGDIRVPHVYMPNGTSKHNRFLAYPLVTQDSALGKAWTNQVYLKFSFANLPAEAVGMQIVVVPRTENDKHIAGQGVFNFAQKDYSSGISSTAFFLSHDAAEGLGGPAYFPCNLRDDGELWHNVGSIKSPDFDFRGFTGYQTGDYIDFVALLNHTQHTFIYGLRQDGAMDGATDPTDVAWTICKPYYHDDTVNVPYCIKNSSADGPIYPVHESFEAVHNAGSHFAYAPGTLLAYSINSRVGNYSPCNTNSASWVTRSSTGSNRVAIIFGGNAPSASGIGGSYDFLSSLFGGRGYADNDNWCSQLGNSHKRYIVNYKRTLNAQYGGNTYAQRSTNIYTPVSNYFNLNNVTSITDAVIAGGDTYTQAYDTVMDFPDWYRRVGVSALDPMDPGSLGSGDNSTTNDVGAAGINLAVPLESTINTELRGKDSFPGEVPNFSNPYGEEGNGNLDVAESFDATDSDLYSWNPYYMIHVAKPLNYLDINEFDTRTYKSEPKSNSEDVDSWTLFKPESYKDVDSKYGPINNLIVFKDRLLFFQDRGFGTFQVNQQQLIQDVASSSELVLGTSGVLDRFDYISNIVGSKTQSGFAMSDDKLLFFDLMNRKLYTFSGEGTQPLSDIKGLNAFLYRKLGGTIQGYDNPYMDLGVTCTYDYRYNEFLISMYEKVSEQTRDYFTVAYSSMTDGFTSFYSYNPRTYINDKLNIFTVPANRNGGGGYIYLQDYGDYGKFYNQSPIDSTLTFVVNHEPNKEKILTNFEFITEAYKGTTLYDSYDPYAIPVPFNFFRDIRVYNSYQNTDYIPTTQIAKRRKTLWNVIVPGNRVLYNNASEVDIFDTTNISPTRLAYTQRMKDRWFVVDALYDNNSNYRFTVSGCTSLVMLNTR